MDRIFERYVACPECGDIRYFDQWPPMNDNCSRCYGAGHKFRMMSVAELTASIEQHERDGFHFVAIKRSLIRDKLIHAEENHLP